MKLTEELKKTSTKKKLKEMNKRNRSDVGLDQDLGTKISHSPKDYNRAKSKKELRDLTKEI